jgi:hypothetical protein
MTNRADNQNRAEVEEASRMPVQYRIDHTKGIIRTRCIGEVTLEEVLSHFQELKSDPECPPRLDALLDLSQCLSAANSAQLRTVSDAIASIRERVQFDACAIVGPTDLLFGVGRMFEVFAEERFRVTNVFRSVADAESWLSSQESFGAARSGNQAEPTPGESQGASEFGGEL